VSPPVRNDERDATIVALHKDGWTLASIGEKYGVSRQRVWSILYAKGELIHRRRMSRPEICFVCGESVARNASWTEHRLSYVHNAALRELVEASQAIVGRNDGKAHRDAGR
jgi:phosphoribosyl-dephospho-CoA transferase